LEKLKQVLDVDRFRTFAALEVFLVHWDGYCTGGPNNYRVFHDVAHDKLVFMPHGMDQLFGVSSSTDFNIMPNFNGLVAKGLFSIPEERQRYRERMAALVANECSVESLHRKVDHLASQLRLALAKDATLQMDIDASIRNLKSRIAARVASVTRQLKEAEQPLAFEQNGNVSLTNWRFKAPSDHPASAARASEKQHTLLQVMGRDIDGTPSSGAWRTLVLLEQGHYEFSGMARATGLNHSTTNTGVILRASGERSIAGLSTNESWTLLRYEFDVFGREDKEIICEFRGAQGMGSFDLNTLKLARKGPARTKTENEQ
jgi:hypothetical protein